MDGKPVVAINYRSYAHQSAAMEKNPELHDCIYTRDEKMEGNALDSGTALKVRQYLVDTDVADLLAMNGLNNGAGICTRQKPKIAKGPLHF